MFNWQSYDLLATTSGAYLKASAYFNNPCVTLFVTFTSYTHISLTFSTRMLIRSALFFCNSHSCLLFCRLFIKLLPCASVTQHSDILFSSLLSPSRLSPYFALCLLLDSTNVVFSISAPALSFTCLFYCLLPFTPQGERMPVSCCIFRLIVRWLLACGRELTVYHTQLRQLCDTIDYFEIFFLYSLFFKSQTILQ